MRQRPLMHQRGSRRDTLCSSVLEQCTVVLRSPLECVEIRGTLRSSAFEQCSVAEQLSSVLSALDYPSAAAPDDMSLRHCFSLSAARRRHVTYCENGMEDLRQYSACARKGSFLMALPLSPAASHYTAAL